MRLAKSWLSSTVAASLLVVLLSQSGCLALGTEAVQDITSASASMAAFPNATNAMSTERHQFAAEVSRLLKILANSVYTDKKATVREVLSNAIDAIEKQHEQELSKGSSATGGLDTIDNYKVVVEVDKENGVISFTDNGIGMTYDELKSFLGTIAKSGTAEFASQLKKRGDATSLIGQFGVGFYSVLLLAEQVAVISKSDQDPKQWIWQTDASASFQLSEDPAGPTLGRGTRVMLKIKADSTDFLDHEKMEKTMKEYFGFDRHRIYLVKPKKIEVEEELPPMAEEEAKKEETKKEETKDGVEIEDEKKDEKPKKKKVEKTILEEVLISQNRKPVWQLDPAEIKPEEYEALYKTLSDDKYGKPIAYTHFSGETAKSESFRAILFIPAHPPFNPFSAKDEQKLDLKLHVRNVFVTAKFAEDFIPKYLSFVKGIIDSDDISLNISREIIQNTGELRGIRKKIIKKIIEMMNNLASDEEKYKSFYDSYSTMLKMAVAEHEEYRTTLAKLLRFATTKSEGKLRSLDQYIEDLNDAQKERKAIYFLAGSSETEVKNSPYLGRFKEKGIEVILMMDNVDEHVIQTLDKYDDFKFENIAKAGKLDEADEKVAKELEEKYKLAKEWVTKSLSKSVERVVLIPGPVSVPGAVKSSQYGWTGNMERIVLSQSSSKNDPMLQFFTGQKKILELNPNNPVVAAILEKASDKPDPELRATLRTLVDAMMVWSGFLVKDTSVFASGVDRLIRKTLGVPVEELPVEEEEPSKKLRTNDDDEALEKDLSLHDLEDFEKAKANMEASSDASAEVEKGDPKKDSKDKDQEATVKNEDKVKTREEASKMDKEEL